MASEYRTAIQITDIWLPDKKLSAIQMVTLFECLVFGSPLYKENVYKLGEHTITLHPWRRTPRCSMFHRQDCFTDRTQISFLNINIPAYTLHTCIPCPPASRSSPASARCTLMTSQVFLYLTMTFLSMTLTFLQWRRWLVALAPDWLQCKFGKPGIISWDISNYERIFARPCLKCKHLIWNLYKSV